MGKRRVRKSLKKKASFTVVQRVWIPEEGRFIEKFPPTPKGTKIKKDKKDDKD